MPDEKNPLGHPGKPARIPGPALYDPGSHLPEGIEDESSLEAAEHRAASGRLKMRVAVAYYGSLAMMTVFGLAAQSL